MRRYNIYLFDRKAVCPKCSGMLTVIGEDIRYRCIDCKEIFKIVGTGQTDSEVVSELITRERGKE